MFVAIRSLIAIGLVVGLVLSPVTASNGQTNDDIDPTALTVAPAILEQGLLPDEPTVVQVRITNASQTPLLMRARAQRFDVDQPLEEQYAPLFDASSWFQFKQREFLLAPQETKVVEAIVTAPVDATPGGHYATLMFEPFLVADRPTTDGVQVTGRVGVLALLTVAGPLNESLRVEQQLHATGFAFARKPALRIELENDGNVHTLASGRVTLKRFGRDAETFDIAPTLVLPHTSRQIEVATQDDVQPGAYSATSTITYGTAKAPLVSKSSPFLVVRVWMVALGAVIGLVLLIALANVQLRRHVKRSTVL